MKTEKPIAVLAGARTPLCKSFTDLSDESAVSLGTHAVKAAIESANQKSESFTAEHVEELVMGHVAGPPAAATSSRPRSRWSAFTSHNAVTRTSGFCRTSRNNPVPRRPIPITPH